MLMANQQSAELPQPCIGSLHDPWPFVAPIFGFCEWRMMQNPYAPWD